MVAQVIRGNGDASRAQGENRIMIRRDSSSEIVKVVIAGIQFQVETTSNSY